MHILLMDLDLLCSKRWLPNLELMQTFQYYRKQGDTIRLATKIDEDLNYYNKIFVFKELYYKTPIKLNLSNDNVYTIGKGFYQSSYKYVDFCKNEEPNYLVYTTMEDKIPNRKKFVNIRNNCLIRLGTNNIKPLKQGSKIYIVDRDNNVMLNNLDFFEQHKKERFSFYSSIIINNIDDYNKIKDFKICDRSICLNFFPNIEDIDNKKAILLLNDNTAPIDKLVERTYNFFMKMKKKNKTIYSQCKNYSKEDLIMLPELELMPYLCKWGYDKSGISFKDFIQDKVSLSKILYNKSNFRLRILNDSI